MWRLTLTGFIMLILDACCNPSLTWAVNQKPDPWRKNNCELPPRSLISHLQKQTLLQRLEAKHLAPVHNFMRKIYLRMKAADESEERLKAMEGVAEPQVKGFIPVTQGHLRGSRTLHMLFNISGMSWAEIQLSSVKLVLTRRRNQLSADGRLLLELTLDAGQNESIEKHSVDWSNGADDKRRIALDVTRQVRDVIGPLRNCSNRLLRLSVHMSWSEMNPNSKHMPMDNVFKLKAKQDCALLVFYCNINEAVFLRRKKGRRLQRTARQPGRYCDVRNFEFPFSKIGYDRTMLLFPPNYTANYCAGDCPNPLTPEQFRVTLYAFLKNKYHLHTDFNASHLPLAKCVPNDYLRMSILYRNQITNSMDAKVLENASVKSCQCV